MGLFDKFMDVMRLNSDDDDDDFLFISFSILPSQVPFRVFTGDGPL